MVNSYSASLKKRESFWAVPKAIASKVAFACCREEPLLNVLLT